MENQTNMKAVVCNRYGGPEELQLTRIAKPIPMDNELLVRVYATTVTAGDTRMRSFNVPRAHWIFARFYLGLFKPKRNIFGMELSGKVEAVGRKVKRFKVGDEVFGSTMQSGFGGYAEYKCFPEDALIAHKSEQLSYTEAASLPIGGVTALRFLESGTIKPGQRVMIYGASGSVGTYAVQLAKHFGAQVTGVCSASNANLVEALGADYVIDYKNESLGKEGLIYDVIFDTVGRLNRKALKTLLGDKGKFISVIANPGKITVTDLVRLNELVEAGKLKPVMDKEYPLEDIREAHRYVDSGRKKGNLAIRIV